VFDILLFHLIVVINILGSFLASRRCLKEHFGPFQNESFARWNRNVKDNIEVAATGAYNKVLDNVLRNLCKNQVFSA
jgi:hypothetical protein